MPILKTQRETREVKLESAPDASFRIYAKQNYGDFLAVQKASRPKFTTQTEGQQKSSGKDTEVDADLSEFMAVTIERMLAAWDYTDEEGNVLPISRNTLEMVPTEVGLELFNKISENTELLKTSDQIEADKKKETS